MPRRSFLLRIALVAISLLSSLGLLFGSMPDVALAQTANTPVPVAGGGIPVAVTANIPQAANDVYHNVLGEITKAMVVAFFNALQTFFGQIAYDAASYIASGGQGQEAQFYKQGIGPYLSRVATDAAGDFIGSLSDSRFFRTLGVNLCQPKSPLAMLNIQLSLGNFFPGLNGAFQRPRPTCSFQDIVQNYNNLYQSMSSQDIFKNISFNVNTNSSDLGVQVGIQNAFNLKIASQVATQAAQRAEGQGFKSVTSIISGNVRTPADVVRSGANEQLVAMPGASQLQMTGMILTNAFQQGPIQLAEYTASVFVNTLASKLLKRVFSQGIDAVDLSTTQISGPQAVVTASATDVRATNLDLKTPNLQKVAQFEVAAELVACPSVNRGLWSCTVDQSLARALQNPGQQGGVTVKEALANDYLHGSWKLIPDTDTADNQNTQCFTFAYCAGNLKKLRLVRILPDGFELAANSQANIDRCSGSSGCATLQEVVNGFLDCSDAGTRDTAHPWCHLIDPSWVIASIPQQCVLSGFGDSLISQELGQRKAECQDVQTCLQRDDHGQCVGGYGYCVADKTVYRFNADECPALYSSCRTFTSRAGQQVSYERNTLDYGQCNANNVGCLWYATTRDTAGGRADNWIGSTSTGPKMYFNSTMETCPASAEGCTKLYAATVGQPALNLILNGSFERTAVTSTPSLLDWLPAGQPAITPWVSTGTAAVDGYASLPLGVSPTVTQNFDLAPSRTYTLSFYARASSTGITPQVTVKLFQYKDGGQTVPQSGSDLFVSGHPRFFISSGCTLDPVDNAITVATSTLGIDWNRFACSFVSASGTASGRLQIQGSQAYADGVELEEGEFATTFLDGVNTDLPTLHMKIPPDDFHCTGDSTDPPACQRFARVCRQSEAGCQGYTDTAAGGPEIPAVVSTNDACPASCVGYAEYRKLPSAFDLVHDADPRFDDPADATSTYFIPSTAAQCTQADVGCEAFTNLEAAATGGESVNYFNYVRSCEKPDANSETFFTWEGSDTTGFQLRTWSLKVGPPELSSPPVAPPNLVSNPSFEGVTGGNYDVWAAPGGAPVPYTPTPVPAGTAAYDGTHAFATPSGASLTGQQVLTLIPSQTYTLSFYARPIDRTAGSSLASGTLFLHDAAHAAVPGSGFSSGCDLTSSDPRISQSFGLTSTWQRFECSFQTAPTAISGTLQIVTINALIDLVALQLTAPTTVAPAETALAPRILAKKGPDQVTFKEPASCGESLWRSGADPDCRQFYDAQGHIFYRYYSQTILSSTQCTNFRVAHTDLADCTKTGGTFNAATGACDYQVYIPESQTCNAAAVSCRAYAGAQAGNTQVIFSESFRNGTTTFTGGDFSSEALLVGDHSWRISSTAGAAARTSVTLPTQDSGLYRVTFWAKSPGAPSGLTLATSDPSTPGLSLAIGRVTLTSDWQRYTVGLFNGAKDATSTILTWTADPRSGPYLVFLDEVSVEQMQDIAYVRMNSWTTPAECDRTQAGTPQPQAMLGCREYKDRKGNIVDLRQFTRLCREQAIACTAFIDTRNSDEVGPQTFVLQDTTPQTDFTASTTFAAATTTRPADRYLYLIDDPSKYCTADNDSCRAFGLPTFSADRLNVVSTSTVYFKDDITKYSTALCKPSEIFCDQFTYRASNDYFRNPQNHTCDYRQNVHLTSADVPGMSLPDGNYDGWFRTGSNTPCYPERLVSGHLFDILRRGDTGYRGWAALCPGQYGECTEFRDPNDTSDPQHRSGKPYYFIRNERLDTTSCAGNVDVQQGCVIMRDISDTQLTYNVAASYQKYAKNHFTPTTPVDCAVNPADANCLAVHATTDDANVIVKVSTDRDCSQWLGCKSAETVLDPATNQYKDVCTNLALCDQVSGQANDIFCAHYVDRSTTSTEPTLTAGAFFDISQYTSRKIGLGQKDYSGYSIPNSFQVADVVSTRVGFEALQSADPNTANRYALDYRLAAMVRTPPFSTTSTGGYYATAPTADNAILLSNATVRGSTDINLPAGDPGADLARLNPNLSLCRHVGTGRIGYYRKADYDAAISAARNTHAVVSVPCYLPVSSDPSSDVFDFQHLSSKFSLANSAQDPDLSRAFPNPECRAYPEADSAFPTSFVTDWDTTTNPFKPRNKVAGYENANTCEYGEDCACSYKRVLYAAANVTKFYNLYSLNIPPGICSGGPRDGQTCLPDTVYMPPQPPPAGTTSTASAIQAANDPLTCGPVEGGGHCVALSKLSIVRGIFGQCLERDSTRNIGNDLTQHPCLTWNPTPILFGEKDIYHFNPAAGYLPPAGSGQYYCVSRSRTPSTIQLTDDDFERFDPTLTGSNRNVAYNPSSDAYFQNPVAGLAWKFIFDTDYLMEKFETWYTLGLGSRGGAVGAHLQGLEPAGEIAHDCRSIKSGFADTGIGSGLDPNSLALRLVSSGRTAADSYSETFYQVSASQFARQVFHVTRPADPSSSQIKQGVEDTNISSISVRPAADPGGKYYLGCGHNGDWVDGLGDVNYGDDSSLKSGESQWFENFNQNYKPDLTRGSEQLFTPHPDDPTSHPFLVPCVPGVPGQYGDGTTNEWSVNVDDAHQQGCYMKTWQVGYRDDGQEKFISLFPQTSAGTVDTTADPVGSLIDIRYTPYFKSCSSDKPYFSIRAVFQTSAQWQGSNHQADLTQTNIQGPWRFVGFWVTTCGGASGDDHYIYMNVAVNNADVCSKLAEVRSKDSHQDAAFTDRIWKDSIFTVPGLGLQYSARYSPYSSALNSGPAGSQGLYMTNSAAVGFSRLKPPTFLGAPVASYYREGTYPKDKWAYLSNLFARIYRIYLWSDSAVSATDHVCLTGLEKGKRCTPDGSGNDPRNCSAVGTCNPSLLVDAPGVGMCDPTAGVNAGTSCDPSRPAGNGVCNSAPLQENPDGSFSGMYTSCDCPAGSPGCTAGSYVCANDSVKWGQGCTHRGAQSSDCPVMIFGHCGANHQCVDGTTLPDGVHGRTHIPVNSNRAPCFSDYDCSFTGYRNPDPYNGDYNFQSLPFSPAACAAITNYSYIPNGACYGMADYPAINPEALTSAASIVAEPGATVDFGGGVTRPVCAQAYRGVAGRCQGGDLDGNLCLGPGSETLSRSLATMQLPAGSPYTCGVLPAGTTEDLRCGLANSSDCIDPLTGANNCEHSAGYYPDPALCPDASKEDCGLVAYNIADTGSRGSLDPNGNGHLPTDVTLGLYTPYFLGFRSPTTDVSSYNYTAYYTPRPPAVAAPDTRTCSAPGQCTIQTLDSFSFDGQSNGPIDVPGGQHKASIKFYGWAAHEQMPLREMTIDWGDGAKQDIADARLKNHKPFCAGQKECYQPGKGFNGLTCNLDTDCPPGAGTCQTMGSCAKHDNIVCRTNADCTVGTITDICTPRTFFGNSSDACETNYFDFSHLYTCDARARSVLPSCAASPSGASIRYVAPNTCYFGTGDADAGSLEIAGRSCTTASDCATAWTAAGGGTLPTGITCGPPPGPSVPTTVSRCSRDPARTCDSTHPCAPGDTCLAGLAPPNGCFDGASNSCRFTPRLLLLDNWGWCTGECRNAITGGALMDGPGSPVRHQYGGCWAGETFGAPEPNIRTNTGGTVLSTHPNGSECLTDNPPSLSGSGASPLRPWIVYPGSLNLRYSGELATSP